MHDWNQLGEPIGFALEGWTPPCRPSREPVRTGERLGQRRLPSARVVLEQYMPAAGKGGKQLSYGPALVFDDPADIVGNILEDRLGTD